MARKSPRRAALEAEVHRLHRAVGQKVSRLERRNGVRIREHGLDPRQSYQGMTSGELARYRSRLEAFNSRSNNYVAGEGGVPLSAASWRAYQRAQRVNNRNVEAFNENLHGVTEAVPGLGRTPSQYNADREGIDRKRARGQWRTFEKIERDASNITGQKELDKLTRAMEKRADPNYLEKRMRQERASLRQMLEKTGDTGKGSLYNRISNMPNAQLMLLIDETDFMNRAKAKYVFVTAARGDTPQWQSQVMDEYTKGMDEQISWARRQPRIDGSSRASVRTKSVDTGTGSWDPSDTRAGVVPVQFNPNDTRARAIPVVRPGRGDKPKRGRK